MKNQVHVNLSRAKIFLMVLLPACVTINVNFPEGAVQKAADDYVRELYKAKMDDSVKKSTPDKQSYLAPFSLMAQAHAQDVGQFSVNSVKAKKIQSSQRGRLKKISSFKKKGFLGESSEGLLVLRNKNKIKPLLRKKIQKLLEAENKDRLALYGEVIKINNLDSDWLPKIKKTFARSFQSMTPSGTWVEAGGQWSKKP